MTSTAVPRASRHLLVFDEADCLAQYRPLTPYRPALRLRTQHLTPGQPSSMKRR
jgi:hypothetical protein